MPFDYINYKRLEYIQSSGTQWINTGINPSIDDEIILDAQLTSVENSKHLFGIADGVVRQITTWQGKIYLQNVNTDTTSGACIINTDTNRHVYKIKNGDNAIDSVTGTTSATNTPASPYYLFIRNSGTKNCASMKCYSLEIKNRIKLVPAKRRSDGVIGMYDEVNNVFYTNQGTGVFIEGPEISPCVGYNTKRFIQSRLPAGYTELEYIESSGTQYIDLQKQNTATSKFYLKSYLVDDLDKVSSLIGSNSQSNENLIIYCSADGQTYKHYFGSFSTIIGYPTGQLFEITADYVAKTLQINADTYTSTTQPVIRNLYLFGCIGSVSGQTIDKCSSQRVYSFKYWNNNTLELDLVPAKNSSNVVGMYDLATGQFFTNAGTGTFIAGPEGNTNIHFTNQRYVLSRLPSAYTELEYIYSNTGGCVVTDVTGWENLKVVLDLDFVTNDYSYYFGIDDVHGWNYAGEFRNHSSFVLQLGLPYVKYATLQTGRHTHTYDGVSKQCWLDNETPVDASSLIWYNSSEMLGNCFRIGTRYTGQTGSVPNLKIYNAKFYRGGTLIRDYISAKRNSDNVLGMYDLVTGQFFTNAGTGDFIAGPEVKSQVKLNNTRFVI